MKKNRDAPIRYFRGTNFLVFLSLLVVLAAGWSLHQWRTLGTLKEEAQEQEMALIQARTSAEKLNEFLRKQEAKVSLAAGESVVAFLEAQVAESGIAKEKIRAITPGDARKISDDYKEAIIKVRLEGISLRELVNYLFNIQEAKREMALSIKGFRLEADRKLPNNWQADIDLASLSYEPSKKGREPE